MKNFVNSFWKKMHSQRSRNTFKCSRHNYENVFRKFLEVPPTYYLFENYFFQQNFLMEWKLNS